MSEEKQPGVDVVSYSAEDKDSPTGLMTAIHPMLTEQAIKNITYDLKMAEKLVTESLEEEIDYGQIIGVSSKGLWDPGASKIINAFGCYPRHKILYHEENDSVITWAIEAEIIERRSGRIVGSGVGACSTREPKYKYRWVTYEDSLAMGYTDPQIESLKTKKVKSKDQADKWSEITKYQVENPEYGEQVNTILKMASKRAETDGAQTLPGVSSALRKLFKKERQYKKQAAAGTAAGKHYPENTSGDNPRWTTFWNAAKDLLGEDYQEKAHKILGVPSVEDWLRKGKSLDDGIKFIAEKLAQPKLAPKSTRRDSSSVKEADVPDAESLERIMAECFGWSVQKVWAEANYANRKNFEEAKVETAWEIFERLLLFINAEDTVES